MGRTPFVGTSGTRRRLTAAGFRHVSVQASVAFFLFALYVAFVVAFHTETGARTTFPPWFAWLKLPPHRLLAAMLYLLPPWVVFAAWASLVRVHRLSPLPGRVLLPAAVAFVLLMNCAVAMTDGGPSMIWRPFDHPLHEYYFDVPLVTGVGQGLREYVRLMPRMTIHARTHPPGGVLFLWAVSKVAGPGLPAAGLAAVVFTAPSVVPAFLLARRLRGAASAAFVLALYAVTPNLVLFGATSLDGVFMLPQLLAVYLFAASVQTPGRRGVGLAILTGAALTLGMLLTFATFVTGTLIALYGLTLALLRPRDRHVWPRLAAVGATFLVLHVALYRLAGYDAVACLRAARASDHFKMGTEHLAAGRWLDISAANLVSFLLGLGVAAVLWARGTIASLRRLPHGTQADRFVIAFAATLLLFSFAGVFTRETERIWIFLSPLALVAAAEVFERSTRPASLVRWSMLALFVQTWLMQTFLNTLW